MRYFILTCLLVLPVYGCESIDVRRYLQAQFCPDVLVLKGAELMDRAIEAELAPLSVDCHVSWRGEVAAPSFSVEALDIDVGVRGRLMKPEVAELKIFIALLRRSDKRIIRRQHFTLTAERGTWFAHKFKLSLQPDLVNRGRQYVFLVGFSVDNAQIERNLRRYKTQEPRARIDGDTLMNYSDDSLRLAGEIGFFPAPKEQWPQKLSGMKDR